MTREKMQHYLDTIPGVGVETVWQDGTTVCHFYEDFFNDPGIDRAMRQIYYRMGLGEIVKATFIAQAIKDTKKKPPKHKATGERREKAYALQR